MLDLVNIGYTHKDTVILHPVTFSVNLGDKISLEGNNGSGKSTLFNIIQRKLEPTSGEILVNTKPLKILSISQPIQENAAQSLKQFLIDFSKENYLDLSVITQILAGLGMHQTTLDKPLMYLSPGNQMRLLIAIGITSTPDILLLDEPDKFLDIESKAYLVGLLEFYPGTFILASYDNELKSCLRLKKIYLFDKEIISYSNFKINSPTHKLGGLIFSARDVSIGYDQPCVSGINVDVFDNDRIGILGRNGCNKSTICKLIAGDLDPLNGRVFRLPGIKVGYLSQELIHSLKQDSTVQQVMEQEYYEARIDSIYMMLQEFGLSPELMTRRVSNLSSGEKTRLALVLLNKSKFNLLVLDEPTIHLDQQGKDLLISAVNKFTGTILIISHDIDFLRNVTTQYWLSADRHFSIFCGNVDDYRTRASNKNQPMPTLVL